MSTRPYLARNYGWPADARLALDWKRRRDLKHSPHQGKVDFDWTHLGKTKMRFSVKELLPMTVTWFLRIMLNRLMGCSSSTHPAKSFSSHSLMHTSSASCTRGSQAQGRTQSRSFPSSGSNGGRARRMGVMKPVRVIPATFHRHTMFGLDADIFSM